MSSVKENQAPVNQVSPRRVAPINTEDNALIALRSNKIHEGDMNEEKILLLIDRYFEATQSNTMIFKILRDF